MVGCKKGRRDCVYPPPSTKPSSRANPRSGESRQFLQESDSSDDNEAGDLRGLETIVDDEAEAEQPSRSSSTVSIMKTGLTLSKKQSGRKRISESSDGSSVSNAEIAAPLDSRDLPSSSFHLSPRREVSALPGMARLPEDLRFFLTYHQEKINHHHYFLRQEADEFVRERIIEHALKYEPLLYAVVGFSAFHHTLHQPHGKLCDFLKYYSSSLTLLRESLASGEPHSEATLITMLQLTTFEVREFPPFALIMADKSSRSA
jgi:Fungal specific transcription factor domain